MAWKDIKTLSKGKREIREVVHNVMQTLSSTRPLANYGLYQVKLYQLLNFLWENKKISPLEVAMALTKKPELFSLVYRLQMTELKNKLVEQHSKMDFLKEQAFVVLYYDNYFMLKKVWRAVRATIKYPYEQFTLTFIRKMFGKYPFLKAPAHLESAMHAMQVSRSSYLLIQNHGIKDVYNV